MEEQLLLPLEGLGPHSRTAVSRRLTEYTGRSFFFIADQLNALCMVLPGVVGPLGNGNVPR